MTIEKLVEQIRLKECSPSGRNRGYDGVFPGPIHLFPQMHRDFLRLVNGCLLHEGYLRLYGVSNPDGIDLCGWNALGLWKFAWDWCYPRDFPQHELFAAGHLDEYIFFGGNGFGDQYAYRVAEMTCNNPTVYMFSTFSSGVIAVGTFENLLSFMSGNGYTGDKIRRALGSAGPLAWREHANFSPPFAVSADRGDIVKVGAAESMIMNADAMRILLHEARDIEEPRFATWLDAEGRTRLCLEHRQFCRVGRSTC